MPPRRVTQDLDQYIRFPVMLNQHYGGEIIAFLAAEAKACTIGPKHLRYVMIYTCSMRSRVFYAGNLIFVVLSRPVSSDQAKLVLSKEPPTTMILPSLPASFRRGWIYLTLFFLRRKRLMFTVIRLHWWQMTWRAAWMRSGQRWYYSFPCHANHCLAQPY